MPTPLPTCFTITRQPTIFVCVHANFQNSKSNIDKWKVKVYIFGGGHHVDA